MWMKFLRLTLCVILLAVLCACGTSEQQGDELEQLNRQISALEAQVVVLEEALAQAQGEGGYEGAYEGESETDYIDVGGLLDRISSSGVPLTSFPALVIGAEVSEGGCTLTIDRLENNPDFTPGSTGDEQYLLNAEAIPEQIDASYAYAQYDMRVEGEISQRFADYAAGFEGGAQFTLYMLEDELVYASEVLVP